MIVAKAKENPAEGMFGNTQIYNGYIHKIKTLGIFPRVFLFSWFYGLLIAFAEKIVDKVVSH